jgi:uncharacterized protein (DUF58 family)
MSGAAPDVQGGRATSRDARRAEALADRLPPLLVAAERVAATVAQGVHGRRRVGQGDSFWQFRPFLAGDAASRIDWRQSARSDGAPHTKYFVRETEWEAAQTVVLWRDGAPGMQWQSRRANTTKVDRAGLLTLALAALLLRGGERVRLLAPGSRTTSGRGGLERLAMELALQPAGDGLPPDLALPRHARVVLIGDLLGPLGDIQATVGRLAAVPVTGHLVQVLDPAEVLLPYSGRIRFEGMRPDLQALIPRVEGIRDAYAKRLAEQQAGLAAICAAAGFGFSIHRTDNPPETALLALYTALAPQAGVRAAGGR